MCLVLVVGIIDLATAEQTVKTIEFPLGYNATLPANERQYYNLSVDFPDGVAEILSMEIQVQGDFLANTNVRAGLKGNGGGDNNCDPVPWAISSAQNNYHMGFDCTALGKQERWQGRNVEFFTRFTKIPSHVKATLKVTYLNNPDGDINLLGTQYYPNFNATSFLQLIDNQGNFVDNASCDITIFNPAFINSSKLFDDIPMTFIEQGIYEFNFVTPDQMGVYKVSAFCVYENAEEVFDLPSDTSFDGSLFDGSTGDPAEVEFSDCVFLKTESNTFQQFDFVDAGIGNLNTSDLDEIVVVWIGQNDKDLNLQIRNFTGSAWVTLGASTSFSSGTSGDCQKSHGASRSVISDFGDFIGGVGNNEILVRTLLDSSGKTLTDNIELRVRTEGTAVNDIRGAGEIVVQPQVWDDAYSTNRTITGLAPNTTIAATINNTELVDEIWNFSGTISTNILDSIANSIWGFFNRTLTAFDFSSEVNTTQISIDVWNFSEGRYTNGIIIP